MRWHRRTLIGAFVFAVGVVCFLWGEALTPSAIKIVSFDLKQTNRDFIQQASHAHLAHPEMTALSKRFARAIQVATAAYAENHHVAILVKGAVVSGANDVTPAIQSLISLRMKQSRDPTQTTHTLLGD